MLLAISVPTLRVSVTGQPFASRSFQRFRKASAIRSLMALGARERPIKNRAARAGLAVFNSKNRKTSVSGKNAGAATPRADSFRTNDP